MESRLHPRANRQTQHQPQRDARAPALIRQLIEGFIDPNRFRQQLTTLNDEEQRFYTYRCSTPTSRACAHPPPPLTRSRPSPKAPSASRNASSTPDWGFAVRMASSSSPSKPSASCRRATSLSAPNRNRQTSKAQADPQLLLTQIQQLLSLIQTQQFTLRKRPQWKTPGYSYGNSYQVWPPVPDARQTHSRRRTRPRQNRPVRAPPLPR